MAKDNRNNEAQRDIDRQFLDLAQQLKPAEIEFMIDLLQTLKADPDKRDARCEFASTEGKQYKLNTPCGRAEFINALQAV